MNLLVTGGCGFIGSNFINYYFYENPDARIVNLDAMYYCASETNVTKEIINSDRYTLVRGNLCSMDLIRHVLESNKIDTIIHFAAQSHVQNSFDDSLQYTNDNVLGTHTLLEASRKYGKIVKFIHISTDEVYGESMIKDDEEKKNESTILCPTNPYAATKAAAELIAKSYYFSFKMPIIITRGNNVYGPNQYPEKLIPRFIELLKNDQKVTIQGDGTNLRAFLHVNDVCSALKCIIDRGTIGEIYNIGSDIDSEYSVTEIANKLIKLIKNTDDYDKWISYIEDRPFNDKRYHISNDKLKKLGWSINVDFDEGLKKLVPVNKNVLIDLHETVYNHTSGGAIVQFEMCRILRELGVNARIKSSSQTINNVCNDYYNNEFPIDDNCIVIYGETIEGNPLNAKNVVRWILGPVGVSSNINIPHTWGKDDLVYYFNSEEKFNINPERIGNIYKFLSSIYINPNIENYNPHKRGTCFTVRKCGMHKDIKGIHFHDSFEITRHHSQSQCIEFFNQYEYFISYDPLTFLSIMAAMCGCVSIVYPVDGLTKQQWIQTTAAAEYCKSKGLDNLYGIAYGNSTSEYNYAFSTIHLVKQQWDDIIKFIAEKTIVPFIKDMQNFENMKNTVEANYF
jgi:dTDP-glucose 4,6-dehydratase